MTQRKFKILVTPEFLRSAAHRSAHHVGRYGWRPSAQDLPTCGQAHATLSHIASCARVEARRVQDRSHPPTRRASGRQR